MAREDENAAQTLPCQQGRTPQPVQERPQLFSLAPLTALRMRSWIRLEGNRERTLAQCVAFRAHRLVDRILGNERLWSRFHRDTSALRCARQNDVRVGFLQS